MHLCRKVAPLAGRVPWARMFVLRTGFLAPGPRARVPRHSVERVPKVRPGALPSPVGAAPRTCVEFLDLCAVNRVFVDVARRGNLMFACDALVQKEALLANIAPWARKAILGLL